MARGHIPGYRSGDLIIRPASGQVTNSQGESIRLGPVNMKVLTALLSQCGEVVTRASLFQSVWGNQIVSDDALTRCVSDIRAELRPLCDRDDLIETLPKRGYRWTDTVQELSEPEDTDSRVTVDNAAAYGDSLPRRSAASIGRLIAVGCAYLAALIVMASLIVRAIDWATRPGPAVIAVLPIAASEREQELAGRYENVLTETLMSLENIEVLSQSAVASRPANPFPYFYFEFGARWLIEGQLETSGAQNVLSIAVVDARTGIVLIQTRENVRSESEQTKQSIERIVEFLETETGGF